MSTDPVVALIDLPNVDVSVRATHPVNSAFADLTTPTIALVDLPVPTMSEFTDPMPRRSYSEIVTAPERARIPIMVGPVTPVPKIKVDPFTAFARSTKYRDERHNAYVQLPEYKDGDGTTLSSPAPGIYFDAETDRQRFFLEHAKDRVLRLNFQILKWSYIDISARGECRVVPNARLRLMPGYGVMLYSINRVQGHLDHQWYISTHRLVAWSRSQDGLRGWAADMVGNVFEVEWLDL